MTDTNEQDGKKKLGLASKSGGRLELRAPAAAGADGQVRQSFSHGRTKTVQVEVRKTRLPGRPGAAPVAGPAATTPVAAKPAAAASPAAAPAAPAKPGKPQVLRELTEEEKSARQRAIQTAIRADVEAKRRDEAEAKRLEEEMARKADEDAKRKVEEEAQRKVDAEAAKKTDAEQKKKAEDETRRLNEEEGRRREAARPAAAAPTPAAPAAAAPAPAPAPTGPVLVPGTVMMAPRAAAPGAAATAEDDDRPRRPGGMPGRPMPGRGAVPGRPAPRAPEGREDKNRRQQGKMSVHQALDSEETIRVRSLAAMKRAREKEKARLAAQGPQAKQVREVVVPEAITVQ
ncbi:MAG: translation initiation factor IF-2 associated domain-containing protein, partial [Proteobacteria bacterium]|nr:translation initiation factor IF-2 associated domain-containing protein [Pseudomonadota bacterium]